MALPRISALPSTDGRLGRQAAAAIRAAIRLAGGREVCFVCTLDEEGVVQSARVVSRGNVTSVLALPGAAQKGEMVVHNHPSGLLEPSSADMEVAARLYEGGVGFGICDNDASELYVVVEVPQARQLTPIEPKKVSADLGPAGPIAGRHGRYEDRPSQRAMAATIAELYNDGGVGLLEAGTVVGKSLGSLVPALRWAAANNERTIVSTNTINLQEQLVGKDLPFLKDALGDQEVRFALLKGWRNYLCLMRLEQARGASASLLEEGMQGDLTRIAEWAEKTRDGSLADLPTPPRPEVWDEVAAEPDLCLRLKCPLYEKCFLFAARKEAAQADVIVVNHHLLLSDVAVRRQSQNWGEAAVLPAYQRLVIDEGHHLEDAAAAHLGSSVTRRALQRLFNRLERRGKGLLPALVEKLGAKKDLLSTASLDLVEARLAPSVHAARDKAGTLFDLLETFMQEEGAIQARLTDEFSRHHIWRAGLEPALEDLLKELELLGENLRLIRERHEGESRADAALAPLFNEMRAVAKRLQASGDGLRSALKPPPGAEPTVRWLELRGKERHRAVTSEPLDLAPIMRDDLFARVETAVVTSATLAAEEKFDFLARRLGLDELPEAPTTRIFPSPFDYPRQALLAVPSDVPAPNADASGHFLQVVRIVLDLATASDGGLFVLFTSHKDLRAAAVELRSRGVERRWPLLVHGEDSRDALVKRFRDAERAVLLGTASFWEGVDVPGRALRGLVIAKLPFKVPTEPVTAAQCEAIEARGGDPFMEYMIPHASLRLKQGFGRLIRSSADRGVIVIADPRIVTKRYGRGLLEALPPARRVVKRWGEIREMLADYYRAEDR